MNFFDCSKSLSENIYFLSGPIVALLAIVGINQLRLTKKAIIITSKRQAAELAAKQVEGFNISLTSIVNTLDEAESANKINPVKMEVGEFNRLYIKSKLDEKEYLRLLDARLKLITEIVDVVNYLDTFSTYFTKGVADEEIA
jgi:hypothetical protein